MGDEHNQLKNTSLDQLCLLIGQLTGKVEALVDALSKNTVDLSTERARIDNIDRWRGGVSIVGPILAVTLPAIVGFSITMMDRPNRSVGLTYNEVIELRRELDHLEHLRRRSRNPDKTFIDPDRYKEHDRPQANSP